jgi:hypothetical protein
MTTATPSYPTTQHIADQVADRIKDLPNKEITTEWLDEFIYEVISEYDHLFIGDTNWYDPEGGDIKDELRDNIMSVFIA